MKARELKDILKKIRSQNVKNLLVKPFNFLYKRQFRINKYPRHSLQIIADELTPSFNENFEKAHPEGTPRIAVFVPFDFRPADFGGATRVYNIYKNLSKSFVVDAVAVPELRLEKCMKAYNNNFTTHIIPAPDEYVAYKESEESKIGGPLHDILLIDQYHLIPELVDLCKRLSYRRDCIISCHPFMFNMIADICRNTILIYEAHDIESLIKLTYFTEDNETSRAYIRKVRDIEEKACRESDLIFAVSQEDRDYMHRHFDIDTDKVVIAQNGVDVRRSTFIDPARRLELRKRVGIKEPIVVFVGSKHGPNIEAVDFIVEELAPQDKRITYIIGGSMKEHYQTSVEKGLLPDNVLLLGIIPYKEKEALYAIGDLAINPMFSGSGTNLKIFDYGAHGLPIISTSFGVRGAPELEGCVTLSEKDTFFNTIRQQLENRDSELRKEMVYRCRRILEERYDWEIIAGKMACSIVELCNKKKGKR